MPPKDLIWQKLASAVVNEPKCSSPVGEGAKRPIGGLGGMGVLIEGAMKEGAMNVKIGQSQGCGNINSIKKVSLKRYLLNDTVLLLAR